MRDDVHAVRFANGSLQDVVGRVTVPLSFGNGPPSGTLLKLVNQFSETQDDVSDDMEVDEEPGHLYNTTIAAEFYVLDGPNNNIILGEDLLASVNAFVCLSGNFKAVTSPSSPYPALATIGLFKKAGKRVCAMVGRTVPETSDPLRLQDIADSKEVDRYERERERIKGLPEQEQQLATRVNDREREAYLRNRNHVSSLWR